MSVFEKVTEPALGLGSRFVNYAKRNYFPVLVSFFFLTGLLKAILGGILGFGSLEQINYATMVIAWILIIERRLINMRMRVSIRWMGILMIFMLCVQCLKYKMIVNETACRLIWYMYYIPFVFLPLLFFFLAANINRSIYDYPLRKLHYLTIPAIALVIFVLTNEWHEQVFKFNTVIHSESDYSHNWGYFLVVAWTAGMLIAGIVMLIHKTRVIRLGRKMLKLIPPVAGCIVLQLVVVFNIIPKINGCAIFNYPEVLIFTVAVIIEYLVRIGLLPTNRRYRWFFEKSTLVAQIENTVGEVKFSTDIATDKNYHLSQEIDKDPNRKISSLPIVGGKVYWSDDLTELNRINQEINSINERLLEGNEMKQTENRIKEEEARYETLNRLYDELSAESAELSGRIREILGSAIDEEDFKSRLALASIYNVFIKRHSNLILLSQENEYLDVKELMLSIKETIEFFKYIDIKASMNIINSEPAPAEHVIEAYYQLQRILLQIIGEASLCYIIVDSTSKSLKVRLMIDGLSDLPEFDTDTSDEAQVINDLKPKIDSVLEDAGNGTKSATITLTFSREEVAL